MRIILIKISIKLDWFAKIFVNVVVLSEENKSLIKQKLLYDQQNMFEKTNGGKQRKHKNKN